MGLIFRLLFLLLFLSGCKDEYTKGIEAFQEGNAKDALSLLEPLCTEGRVKACVTVASIYAKSDPSPFNQLKAFKALQKACKYGYGDFCEIVVNKLYLQDNSHEVIKWIEQGCKGGNPKLCFDLANEYFWRSNKTQSQALEFFSKSCYGGYSRGCEVAIEMLQKISPHSTEIKGLQKQMIIDQ